MSQYIVHAEVIERRAYAVEADNAELAKEAVREESELLTYEVIERDVTDVTLED